jgi:hypothetical protein
MKKLKFIGLFIAFILLTAQVSVNYPRNIPYYMANLSASQTLTTTVVTKLNINTEIADSNGWYDNATNYRYTPLLAGKYRFRGQLVCQGTTVSVCQMYILKNGSITYTQNSNVVANLVSNTSYTSAIIDMNGTTDYIEFQGRVDCTGTCIALGGTAPIYTFSEASYIAP